jgi:hypothetical protein
MKFLIISFIIIGILIFFNAGGIETPAGGLVFQFLNGGLETFKSSDFWITLKTILTLGIAGTAVAGLFSRAPPESYLIAGLVFTLGGVVLTDMISIYTLLWQFGEESSWIRWVVTAIFIPLFFGFFSALISYWRGTDY